MILVKKIHYSETYPVRHSVLREGKPIESCFFEGDELNSSQHYGLFLDSKIIGIVSLFEKENELFLNKNQIQLRGMAVLKEYQKKGFGEILIQYCESELKKMNRNFVWFNARINAVPFYEKLGYEKTGAVFEIKEVGKHYVMFKKL